MSTKTTKNTSLNDMYASSFNAVYNLNRQHEEIDKYALIQAGLIILFCVVMFYKYEIANYFKIESKKLVIYSIIALPIAFIILKQIKNILK